MSEEPARVLFAYWGRRGGGARMALDLARAAVRHPGYSPTISISTDNELFDEFRRLGDAVFPVETFASGTGALLHAWRLPALRRRVVERLRRDRIQAVVTLMPHVWSPLVAPAITHEGIAYVTIVHDGAAHPGDRTGLVHGWLLRDCAQADLVVTLSHAVARHLSAEPALAGKRIATLFSPDMGVPEAPGEIAGGLPASLPFPQPGQPFRLAFVGRIMPYKGLDLLIEAVRLVRDRGYPVSLGVFGEGELGRCGGKLMQLGAEVDNRWHTEAELSAVLGRHHAVVLSHTEASQSGVAALAGGHGVPVITTPVGGLIEQVCDGTNGIVAASTTATGLADAMTRLAGDKSLYDSLCTEIRATRQQRSFARFLDELLPLLLLRGSKETARDGQLRN